MRRLEPVFPISLLRPIVAVERAVLDGFGDVAGGDILGAFQVGDGAGDLEDTVVGG